MLNFIVAELLLKGCRDFTQNMDLDCKLLIGLFNKSTLPFRKRTQFKFDEITTPFGHLLIVFLYPE